MKALRVLRALATSTSTLRQNPYFSSTAKSIFPRFYAAAQPLQTAGAGAATASEDDNSDASVFDSSRYDLPNNSGLESEADAAVPKEPTWDEKYRWKANKRVFGEEAPLKKAARIAEKEEEKRRRAALLARELLDAAVDQTYNDDDDDDVVVKEEDQKTLSVGIIGAPNAGKSALTNYMVGKKVAAVSRKTNTTTEEVLGAITKGDTQICIFDTPGLILRGSNGLPKRDIKARVESAWSAIDLYDVIIVIFDVHRHLNRPDKRVVGLIKRMGSETNPKQKRVLCMNKVDLVEKKKDLLKVAEQFKDLPGYEEYFMISGLKGSGVKDLTRYLMDQAVKRPWEEDPLFMTEEVMKNISLEVVREKLLDYVHQEIPHEIEHRLAGWHELRDGSLRIEQHFISDKMSKRRILIGKNGSKIGRIGMDANAELRTIFKRKVHLILLVKSK